MISVYICVSLTRHITLSRSAKGKWESPLFLSIVWMNILKCLRFNSIDRMKRKTNEKTKKAKQSVHRKTRLLQSRYCRVCVAWPIVWLLFWFQLSLRPCLQHSQIHSMRSNNNNNHSDEMENWWSRENFCYNAKIANIYFIQSKMGNNMHALV